MLRLATFVTCLTTIHVTCTADRVITVPSAYTLRQGEGRLEYSVMPSKAKTAWFRFDAGVLPFLEVQAVQETMAGDETLSINVQYGVVQPFADAAPGISIGVLDLLNQTDLGRSPFIAMTWQFNTYADWATKERASFTLGGGLGGLRDGAFVGVELPLFKRTNFVGEYDRRAITAGFDIEASKGVAVRALFREGAPIIGVQVRRRF